MHVAAFESPSLRHSRISKTAILVQTPSGHLSPYGNIRESLSSLGSRANAPVFFSSIGCVAEIILAAGFALTVFHAQGESLNANS
jgi:hypothetical protein